MKTNFQEISLYREYLQFMDAFLQKEANQSREHLESYVGPTSGDISPLDIKWETEKFDQYSGYIDDLYFNYSLDEFSNVLRRSLFANLYAFLESRMLKLCRENDNTDIKVSLSDIRGSGIDKAKTYLTKVIGISYKFGREWMEIQKYKTLRHCVVHYDGRLGDGFLDRGNDLKIYIEAKDSLSLSSDGIILFEKEFCEEVLDVIEGFLEEMRRAL